MSAHAAISRTLSDIVGLSASARIPNGSAYNLQCYQQERTSQKCGCCSDVTVTAAASIVPAKPAKLRTYTAHVMQSRAYTAAVVQGKQALSKKTLR
eukprot:8858-Heterococcus_DN1.PRE.2